MFGDDSDDSSSGSGSDSDEESWWLCLFGIYLYICDTIKSKTNLLNIHNTIN